MPTVDFTPTQHQVLWSLAEGQTIGAAAAAAGVHRNTVLNWRRGDTNFRVALDAIHYERAMHWREQCLPLAPLAMDAIREILENPETKPALRLRVALAIHKIVSTPMPAQQFRETPLDWDMVYRMSGTIPPLPRSTRSVPPQEVQPQKAEPRKTENDAQSCTMVPEPAPTSPQPELVPKPAPTSGKTETDAQSCTIASGISPKKPESMHASAQSPTAISSKPGRNAPCPCRSGRKFKHCCLGKQAAA